jgi:indolepyruvate ferredoxin oxidoreductase beta subunit
MTTARPIAVLVAALGGEGGGVLTDWIVHAAMASDLPVQSTSIPGVAQRTGATTYYIEVFPETNAALASSGSGTKRPVFGLYPCPGDVDAMVASELLEAGRAAENGFVTPDRTTLVAATHRVYATIEKSAMGDGRADAPRVLQAVREMARRPILFDLTQDPQRRSLPLNAVLLGALAASGVLPIADTAFTAAIRESGIAVEANLAGFAAGQALARGELALASPPAPRPDVAPASLDALLGEAARLPQAVTALAAEGIKRCADFQDLAHAQLYLARVGRIAAADHAPFVVAAEAARRLALWMCYEDVIRVADLKTRAARFVEVRAEVRAKPDEPIAVTEFFKPGIEEVAAILPAWLGRRLQRWGERRDRIARLHLAMHVRTTTVWGFVRLWLVARLKFLRRRSFRYTEENAAIEQWLAALGGALARDPALAAAIATLPRLRKGYGDTLRRGCRNYDLVMTRLVAPALAGSPLGGASPAPSGLASRVAAARDAALADPEGGALNRVLDSGPIPARLAAE